MELWRGLTFYWGMCFISMLSVSIYDGQPANWGWTIVNGVMFTVYWFKFVQPKKTRTNFTWWVYWVAIRRARADMNRAFGRYYTGLGSSDEYMKCLVRVEAVRTRRMERLFSAPYYS